MTKRFLIISIVFVVFTFCAFAQLPLSISGSLNGGLLFPQSKDLKGDFSDSHNYPLSKTSYTVGGKLRFNVAQLPISFVGLLSYNSLTDNDDLTIFGEPNGFVTTKYTYSLSILTTGIGVEYSILPLPLFKPYLGADIVANIYFGSGGDSKHFFPDAKLKSTNRFGVNFEIGTLVEIPILPISFDIELKYCLTNVGGKEFTSTVYPFGGYGWLPQTSVYDLNDAINPNDPNDHSRSINYIILNIGVVLKII